MFKKLRHERGQALVIIVAAMIGLIGMVGLAVDGGMAFSDRRHAQNAADTAALAGSLARINEDTNWRSVAWGVADENGYDGLLSNDVDVYLCSEAAASCTLPEFANPDDYIQVIITSWFDTFFAKVVGITTVTNRVEAIAIADTDDSGPLANGEAIVALSPNCQSPDNFIVEGGTIVNVTGGGLFVNTDDPDCGLKCDSNANTINGSITTIGGTINMSENCELNSSGPYSQGGSPIDYPITLDDIGLDIPAECYGDFGTYTNISADQSGSWSGFQPGGAYHSYAADYAGQPITVIHPGFFNQFPPPKDQPSNSLNDVMFLDPGGIYCVADVLRWNQPKFVLIGHDNTLFIRAGYDFSITGGIIDIDAPDSGPYAGYLIVVEPDYGNPIYSENPEACTINGSADNSFEGTIFAPYCNCTLNGDGSDYGFNAQLLCYTVDITGGGIVNFTYDASVNGQKIDPPKIGLTK